MLSFLWCFWCTHFGAHTQLKMKKLSNLVFKIFSKNRFATKIWEKYSLRLYHMIFRSCHLLAFCVWEKLLQFLMLFTFLVSARWAVVCSLSSHKKWHLYFIQRLNSHGSTVLQPKNLQMFVSCWNEPTPSNTHAI